MNKEISDIMKKKLIEAFIRENYVEGQFVSYYNDSNKIQDDAISKVLACKTSSDAYDVLSEVFEESTQYDDYDHDSAINEVKDDILKAKLTGIDEDYLDSNIDIIEDVLSSFGIYKDERMDGMLDVDVKLDVYPSLNGSIPLIGEVRDIADYNDLVNGKGSNTDYSESFDHAMKIMGVSPLDVQGILQERDLIPNNSIPWPKSKVDGISALDFVEELENANYGGCVVFTCTLNIEDYINNIDHYHEHGIVVPKGTPWGIHDWINGSGGFIGGEIKEDMLLGEFELMNDNNHRYGYGVDNICGLSSSVWTDNPIKHKMSDLNKSRIVIFKELLSSIDKVVKIKSNNTPQIRAIELSLSNAVNEINKPSFNGDLIASIKNPEDFYFFDKESRSQSYDDFKVTMGRILYSGTAGEAYYWVEQELLSNPKYKSEFEVILDNFQNISSEDGMRTVSTLERLSSVKGGIKDNWGLMKDLTIELFSKAADTRYDKGIIISEINTLHEGLDNVINSMESMPSDITPDDRYEVISEGVKKAYQNINLDVFMTVSQIEDKMSNSTSLTI